MAYIDTFLLIQIVLAAAQHGMPSTLLLTACCVCHFNDTPRDSNGNKHFALSGWLHGRPAGASAWQRCCSIQSVLTACSVGCLQGRPEEELATQILQCLPGSEAALLVPPSHQEPEWQDSAVELAGIAAKCKVEWGPLKRSEAFKALVLMSNMQASLTQPGQAR